MRKGAAFRMVGVVAAMGVAGFFLLSDRGGGGLRARDILSGYDPAAAYTGVNILYPYNGAVFPPESIPPTFTWRSRAIGVSTWLVHVAFEAAEPLQVLVSVAEWTPDKAMWKAFKAHSSERPARVTVLGVAADSPGTVLEAGAITLTTSTDPVDAPLFYRDVPLPFIEAVKDPTRIRWRFGAIDSGNRPPVVLENLPVCGNCHSFSADGSVLGMDVDYANDKGSYILTKTAKEIALDKSKVISWSNYLKEDKQPTFGLLSQVSPDGRFAVSTVKDRSVFVPKSDIAFSQLFFPLKGILAFYDRETGSFEALPGADDPAYVHSNPVWSPDGKHIVFARSKAYDLKHIKDASTALLTQEECREFLEGGKIFRFDLYRIPFNGGKGGEAVPIEGASGNGKSNFFAKYSPDGKWIVFCQANSFMLLQPDSELYIIPAEGGEARRLGGNMNRMNSWHSWSPNNRWLVFASKANTPYTQLFLTHMDERGNSAPPIVLSHFTAPDRAANIPEFVNLPRGAITAIREAFVDDESYVRTALENIKVEDFEAAAALYRKALSLNPDNAAAHTSLGWILTEQGRLEEAYAHLHHALGINPEDSVAYYNLGNALAKGERYAEAEKSWRKTIALDPGNTKARSNLGMILLRLGRMAESEEVLRDAIALGPENAEAHHNLGNALLKLGRKEEAMRQWQEAVRLDGSIRDAHQNLGVLMLEARDLDAAVEHLTLALQLDPNDVPSLMNLAAAHAEKGNLSRAAQLMEEAVSLARKSGRVDIEQECLRRLHLYRGR